MLGGLAAVDGCSSLWLFGSGGLADASWLQDVLTGQLMLCCAVLPCRVRLVLV